MNVFNRASEYFARTARLFTEKGAADGVHSLAWKITTQIQKRWILTQEEHGWYPYAPWLRKMEQHWQVQRQRDGKPAPVGQPVVSFLIASLTEPDAAPGDLERTLRSLQSQEAHPWEVFLDREQAVGPGTVQPERIHARLPGNPFGLLGWVAETLDQAAGEWVVFCDPGDTLSPAFLVDAVAAIRNAPEGDIFYTDEDSVSEPAMGAGPRPWFKPDWSPELLLSVNYLRHGIFRKDLLARVVGSADPAATLDDLVFLATEAAGKVEHIPRVLYHRFAGRSQALSDDPKLRQPAVKAHLERSGFSGVTARVSGQGQIQVSARVENRLVSIIIPTRDKVAYLQKCVSSILQKTAYQNYEIILIDTGSVQEETRAYYRQLKNEPCVQVHEDLREFNYSRVNNLGVKYAAGEVLLFLNNDVEVIEAGWLDEMVFWCERPEIGAVGAKLLYPDGSIQHAGIVIGMEGHASHIYSREREGHTGIFGSTEWYRNTSAVTGACLMLRREVFERIGGFDEKYRLVFNDVEFCQRILAHGYRILYTPYARLIHHEGASRGTQIPTEDIRLGFQHLIHAVEVGDPYYNPNLSLAVRRPVLRRLWEEDPITRLGKILRLG